MLALPEQTGHPARLEGSPSTTLASPLVSRNPKERTHVGSYGAKLSCVPPRAACFVGPLPPQGQAWPAVPPATAQIGIETCPPRTTQEIGWVAPPTHAHCCSREDRSSEKPSRPHPPCPALPRWLMWILLLFVFPGIYLFILWPAHALSLFRCTATGFGVGARIHMIHDTHCCVFPLRS